MVKHVIPNTFEEVLQLLNEDVYEIISGGTDLMVQRRQWADTAPKFNNTINIFNLKELNYIRKHNDHLHIGATTPMSDILKSDLAPKLLKDAIYEIAAPALRNLATIAGNIGNASPAGDTLPVLYLHNASVKLRSLNSERYVAISDYILGPRKTDRKQNEIIEEIIVPLDTFDKSVFRKIGGRKADAISKISFAAAVTIQDEIIEDIRFAFGAVGPVMVRDKNIENLMIGLHKEEIIDQLPKIIDYYSEIITPINDQRSNIEYRKHVALNLLMDFLLNI